MIKKLNNGYHVYSESGKHFGGPYTLEQAKHRLAQMEFFKHKKTASVSTYPLSRLLGTGILLSKDRYSKALVGRKNTSNSVFFPGEKKLIDSVNLPDKNSYKTEQALTNPLVTAPVFAGVGAGTFALRKYLGPKAFKFFEEIHSAKQLEGHEQAFKVLDEFRKSPVFTAWQRMVGVKGAKPMPEDYARLAKLGPKDLLKTMGTLATAAALWTGAERVLYPRIVKGMAAKESKSPDVYIRTKLREEIEKQSGINPALIDDAAIYLTKAVTYAEEKIKEEEMEKEKNLKKIKPVLQKKASIPLPTSLKAGLKDLDIYGKAFFPKSRNAVALSLFVPVPGSTEAMAASYALLSAHAREMIRNPKYQKVFTTILQHLPK